MNEWYVLRNKKTHGPFTEKQILSGIRSKKISPSTKLKLFNDGSWQSVDKFPNFEKEFKNPSQEIKNERKSDPPVTPPKENETEPLSDLTTQPSLANNTKTQNHVLKWLLVGSLVVIASLSIVIVIFVWNNNAGDAVVGNDTDKPVEQFETLLRQSVRDAEFEKVGFDYLFIETSVRYDVQKTNSLVTPYVATITFRLAQSNRDTIMLGLVGKKIKYDLVYQNGQWRFAEISWKQLRLKTDPYPEDLHWHPIDLESSDYWAAHDVLGLSPF